MIGNPPKELNAKQKVYWRGVVKACPWLTDSDHGLLVSYCRAAALRDSYDVVVEAGDGDPPRLSVEVLRLASSLVQQYGHALGLTAQGRAEREKNAPPPADKADRFFT